MSEIIEIPRKKGKLIKLVTGSLTSLFYVENVVLTEASSDVFHKAKVLNVCFPLQCS